MKTTTNQAIKKYLTLGCLFIAFLGFAQTITISPKNPTICGEDNVLTINARGGAITWSFVTPVDAYINNPPTILYTNQQVSTIYLKPNLSQLESCNFIIKANATLNDKSQISQIITVKNNTKVWRGGSNTNWNNPNNWKPYGIPTESNCVVVNENVVISKTNYNAYAKNITVKSIGTLEIQTDNNLRVTDWINVNPGGIFNIRNNASLVQTNDNANSGKIRIERITQPMSYYDYTYWNSPVTLASGFTLGSLSPQTLTDLWSYSPTVLGGSGNWLNLTPSTVMDPTKGYIVKAPDTFSSSTTTKVTYTATFVGTPNNGTILTPVSKGTNANIGGLVDDEDDEWNLIGNPYPSGIDAKKFLDLPENLSVIDGTIYVWTQISQPTTTVKDPFYGDYVLNYTLNDYASFNKTGATGTASSATNEVTTPTGFVATGQSFFVKAATTMANGTTKNVTFNNSMRIEGKNSDFIETSNNAKNTIIEEKNRIWLNLTNNSGAFSQTLIGYITDATQGLDRGFDGESFSGNNVTFYSIIPEAKLTIQGRALPFDANDTVILGYNAAKKGNYSIRIDHLDGIFESQSIYLEDKDLNVIYDLKQKPYVFSTKVGDFNNRFVLRYGGKTLGVDKNNIKDSDIEISYIKNSNNLIIHNNSLDTTVEKVTLFNILGQSISTWKIENQEQQNIQIPIKSISSGIYIAKLKTLESEISKKIIIN
ncbi:T9SS type A sorting domain-containing protein [Flavobacterium soyangense]|uniref:T9SS type A sorting domain-containing protein n=1 Tax=Flavobacterium soyangense TaxID=2023265 RepID=A0A930UEG3_9FLAO|nr:T9SS type A sorting domain-containing protein [Flavobacterium soyangense]MBF2709914.1 T9SS type A sorting domain-containing protein [Flavobacterium soyangense]